MYLNNNQLKNIKIIITLQNRVILPSGLKYFKLLNIEKI